MMDVITAGHICLDITPTFPGDIRIDIAEYFQAGRLIKIGDAVISTGGAVSNTGIALSKLGLKVSYMANVGNDSFGDIIIAKMARYGEVDGFFRDQHVGSSYSVILALPAIDRIILHNPGCNDNFTSANINWEIVSKTRLFHLGYPPIMRSLFVDGGCDLARIFKKVKSLGVTTSLDMALPDPHSEAGKFNWLPWLQMVAPHIDFFLPSIEEMLLFLDRSRWVQFRSSSTDFIDAVPISSYSEIAGALINLGCGVVILKAGHRGLYIKTAGKERIEQIELLRNTDCVDEWTERELWGASFLVESVKSATGAGDSAVAGILAALLREKTIEETLQFGNCLGFQNLRGLDTTSGIGTYAETETLLSSLEPNDGDFLGEAWMRMRFNGIWQQS